MQALDIGLGIVLARHPVLVDQEGRDRALHPEHLVECVAVIPVGPVFLGAFQLILRDPPGELGLVVERVIVELLVHLLDRFELVFQLALGGEVGRVVPFTIILALHAQIGLGHRATRDGLVPFLLEESVDRFGLGQGRLGGLAGLGSRFRRGLGRGRTTGRKYEKGGYCGCGLAHRDFTLWFQETAFHHYS